MSDDEYPGASQPESRFFEPTERCPHPERWTSTDGDSTEVEVSHLIAGLIVGLRCEFILETGAAFGQTTLAMASAIHDDGDHRGYVTSLEPNHDRAEYARAWLAHNGVSARAEIIEKESMKYRPETPIDFLFADSMRELRVDEALRFMAWMRKGATIAIHDSAWDMGPLRGWIENSLVKPGYVRAIDLPTPRGLTLCEVLHTGMQVPE